MILDQYSQYAGEDDLEKVENNSRLKTKRVIFAIVALFVMSLIALACICNSWWVSKIYQYGLIKYPILGNVRITMRNHWYPGVSSDSLLGYFVKNKYPFAIYNRNKACADIESIYVTRIPEEDIKKQNLRKRRVSNIHYQWGDVEEVKSKDNSNEHLFFINKYHLFITVNDISSLNDIVKIEKVE